MYYLRSKAAAAPIQFTVDQKVVQQVQKQKEMEDKENEAYKEAALACSRQNREACIMCSA